jgi:hypothetical protein
VNLETTARGFPGIKRDLPVLLENFQKCEHTFVKTKSVLSRQLNQIPHPALGSRNNYVILEPPPNNAYIKMAYVMRES